MASLEAIRDAVKATLEARIDGLHCYDTVPSSPNLPAVAVMPALASFARAMGRGEDDTYSFQLAVLVSVGDNQIGQDALDQLVTGAGPRSIRQAIWDSRQWTGSPPHQLGLPDVKAWVTGMDSYAIRFDAVGVNHLGANLRLEVVTSAI